MHQKYSVKDLSFVKRHFVTRNCFLRGYWYTFNVTPLPPQGEIEKVLYDICLHNYISFDLDNGQILHDEQCDVKKHNLKDECINVYNIMNTLIPQTFKVAVWEGYRGANTEVKKHYFNGQPIAFVLEPEISFDKYPDHPHLSTMFGFPDSLCYTNNPDGLGSDIEVRVYNAIKNISEWLLRFQVWIATRNNGNAKWIGRQVTANRNGLRYLINPNGKCHCLSGKKYKDCCIKADYTKVNLTLKNKDDKLPFTLESYPEYWKKHNALKNRNKQLLLSSLMRSAWVYDPVSYTKKRYICNAYGWANKRFSMPWVK